MMTEKTILLDGNSLQLSDVINVGENGYKIKFQEKIKDEIIAMRKQLEDQLRDFPEIKIYGTNRLHGDLKNLDVDYDIIASYQEKYVKVHNCATGKELPIAIVRAIMVLRLNSFAKMYSGMRWETIELLLEMLNQNITPVVLEEGSVGASGDLVPLAMIASAMIGLAEAEVYFKGKKMPAQEGFRLAKLSPIVLGAKEAMGLTNGSNLITALGIFAWRDASNILKTASISGALSLEAIRGEKDAFDQILHHNRPHEGQLEIANQIRELIDGSQRMSPEAQLHPFTKEKIFSALKNIANKEELSDSERESILRVAEAYQGEVRVQDRYSFRAIPQVHGPAYEALQYLEDVLFTESNSVTDNPLFKEVEVREISSSLTPIALAKLNKANKTRIIKAYSGANFHGQVIAQAIDHVKIAMTTLGLLSDKRSFTLLHKALNYHLPADLAYNTKNADGGLMILQYAGAARAAENRILASPSSISSVATSANQEDYVSMGVNGALHLMKINTNNQKILAVELVCALRAIQLTYTDLPENLRKLGKGTQTVYAYLSNKDKMRNEISVWEDHYLRTDLEKMIEIVKNNELVELLS